MEESEVYAPPTDQLVGEPRPLHSRHYIRKIIVADVLIILLGLLTFGTYQYSQHLNTPPTTFVPQEFVITPGESVSSITNRLAAADVVRSAELLQLVFRLYGTGTEIKAGAFMFDTPLTTKQVADKLVTDSGIGETVTITFIEGEHTAHFGHRAAQLLPAFDEVTWQQLTVEAEGTLFPDTYFFTPDFNATDVFNTLSDRHDEVVTELRSIYASSTVTDNELITLASILEREANDEESMRTVAGIFQNRLQIGMPLQADATIEYVLETPLGELPPGQLATELRELDSPYNTYQNAGLTPTPIGNPGRQAMAAVLNPITSDYLYYLTSADGAFYYAQTYNQHLTNIERHLR